MNQPQLHLFPEIAELSCSLEAANLLRSTIAASTRGPAEADFVLSVVGVDVVERNDVAHTELLSLVSILTDMRESASAANRPQKSFGSSIAQARQHALRNRLAALLENSKASTTMINTQREKMVAEYLVNGSQRPTSAAARPLSRSSNSTTSSLMHEAESRPTTASRPQSRGSPSMHVDPTKDLQHLVHNGSLQFDRVHEVKRELVEVFAAEHDALLEDIETVRALIDDEVRWMHFSEPTSHELTQLNSKLDAFESQQDHEQTVQSLLRTDSLRKTNALPALVPSPPPKPTRR